MIENILLEIRSASVYNCARSDGDGALLPESHFFLVNIGRLAPTLDAKQRRGSKVAVIVL